MQSLDVETITLIIWIVALILLVSLMVWLTVRLSEGKSSEEGKRYFKSLVIALIGTFAAVIVYYAMSLEPYGQFTRGAAPYLVYIIWLGLCYWIFDISWKNAILVSFVALLFIVVFLSILQLIPQIDLWYFNYLIA
ncbi:MAG: hypothetical protein ACTSVY_16300 [Candidatus Helarchaeota archaeon]